jgi:hypothetical protein
VLHKSEKLYVHNKKEEPNAKSEHLFYSSLFVWLFETETDAFGGGARQLAFLSRELTDEFEVHLVLSDYEQPKREVRDGVTLHKAYSSSPGTLGWKKPFQLWRLFNAMRRANTDVYIYRGVPYKTVITYTLTRLLELQWIYSLFNDPNLTNQTGELPLPIRRIFEWALRDAAAIICQTESQAEILRETRDLSSTWTPTHRHRGMRTASQCR